MAEHRRGGLFLFLSTLILSTLILSTLILPGSSKNLDCVG
jgi:hypothetical protein